MTLMGRSQRQSQSVVGSQHHSATKSCGKSLSPVPHALRTSRGKKLAFAVTTVLGIFVSIELALWAAGVSPAYLRRDPYAGFTPQVLHFQVEKDGAGQEVATIASNKKDALNAQTFPRHKPAGSYRIVCLGGSATYGRPFYDLTSFPGWLRALLPKADPSRKWEVINAGAISYASYRIKGLMAELAGYEPDLFIVYTGENEFLERRTYAGVFNTPGLIKSAAGLASRLRIATVTQRGLEMAGLLRPTASVKATGIQDEVHRVPVDSVGPEAYTRDETFQRQVLAHFETSLNAMVDIAAQAKAKLLFVTPVSNLRDFAPFKSENQSGLSPQQLRTWQTAYEKGRAFLKQGQWEDATQEFNAALAIDDRYADLLYRKGQARLALGKDDEAREFLVRARDEDICPFRATSATLSILRRVASEREVPLLDWETMASSRSEHGIPGGEVLADHVHLQVPASRTLALDLVDWMAREKIATLSTEWGPSAVEEVARQVEARIDHRRYAQELYNLSRLLEILGQPDQSLKRVEEGLKLSGGDVEGLCLAGRYASVLGKTKEAADFFQQALALQPAAACAEEGLGGLLLDQGRPQDALKHLESAVRSVPDSPLLLNRLGVAHAQLGRHDEAVPFFQQAARLNPSEPQIQNNLGYSEECRGRSDAAVLHYREALRLKPDNAQAGAGLRRLLAAPQGRTNRFR
jgi:tetratricopeptide (TPR) repeat protein